MTLSFIAHTVRWSLASPSATLGPWNQFCSNSYTKTTQVGTLIIFKALSVSSTPVLTEQQRSPKKRHHPWRSILGFSVNNCKHFSQKPPQKSWHCSNTITRPNVPQRLQKPIHWSFWKYSKSNTELAVLQHQRQKPSDYWGQISWTRISFVPLQLGSRLLRWCRTPPLSQSTYFPMLPCNCFDTDGGSLPPTPSRRKSAAAKDQVISHRKKSNRSSVDILTNVTVNGCGQ